MSAAGPPRYSLEARSYEIDLYGHVNNAVFVSWLEHGRLVWLRDRGMTYESIPEAMGVHIVVVALQLAYKAEVVTGDRLVVSTDVVRVGNSSFTFAHRIEFEDGRLAAEGEVTMVSTQDGRSAPLPAELREKLR
jgi:thioesterase-3